MAPTTPHCGRCRNHGLVEPLRGHKQKCPYKYCFCELCALGIARREVMSQQNMLTRLKRGSITPVTDPDQLTMEKLEESSPDAMKLMADFNLDMNALPFVYIVLRLAGDVHEAAKMVKDAQGEFDNLTDSEIETKPLIPSIRPPSREPPVISPYRSSWPWRPRSPERPAEREPWRSLEISNRLSGAPVPLVAERVENGKRIEDARIIDARINREPSPKFRPISMDVESTELRVPKKRSYLESESNVTHVNDDSSSSYSCHSLVSKHRRLDNSVSVENGVKSQDPSPPLYRQPSEPESVIYQSYSRLPIESEPFLCRLSRESSSPSRRLSVESDPIAYRLSAEHTPSFRYVEPMNRHERQYHEAPSVCAVSSSYPYNPYGCSPPLNGALALVVESSRRPYSHRRDSYPAGLRSSGDSYSRSGSHSPV